MEIKTNEATKNRPGGARALDAPSVLVNLDNYISQLKYEETWQKNDRNSITVFKTAGCTMVLAALHANAVIDEYKVKGVVIVQVLEGSVQVNVAADTIQAGVGQMVALHDDAAHSIEALERSVVLLTII